MKLLFALTIGLITSSTFSQLTINGNIENGTGKKVYLSKLDKNTPVVIDSAVVSKKGKVQFTINKAPKAFYRVSRSPQDFVLLVGGPGPETVNFTADYNAMSATYTVADSKDNELIQYFLAEGAEYKKHYDSLRVNMQKPGNNSTETRNAMNELSRTFIEKRKAFVFENKNSPAVLIALQYMNPQQDIEEFKVIVEASQKSMPGSFYAEALKLQLESLIVVGNTAPELAYPDTSGNIIKLSDLRGKYVLIDFWASWCGPCRRENPHVVHLYDTYQKDGFEVFSVSLDRSMDRWKGAIIQDNLKWPYHVSDLKQWQSEPAAKYGVRSIPHTVLIGPKGKILAVNLRGQALDQKLQEIFGH